MIDSKILAMNRMLEAKEKRYYKIKSLTEKFESPVLSFMLNIPGEDKNFKEAVDFHKKYIEKIKKLLEENKIKILFEDYEDLITGMEYIGVLEGNGREIKKLMIEMEEESLGGRLLDLDIYDKDFSQISRSSLGLPERKCIICGDTARTCIKEERHDLKELEDKVREIIIEDLDQVHKF
ncbi:2'-(5''-triphosphoribosyl)-3'-dephospho-CoA:apo-citrate lyase [Peptoniphilus harei]|uniref:citrate lyase holo-[acyl-carrier protein] synthase n=1 Tax=Peptoniphilus harei TaxID=54005 RepID=UPI000F6C0D40|nr:citrate lyase holo-[acyl-carrier protein] synthase [Peptoniphilus harei]QQE46424.1 citrate lyase holo-[acyl-carrier protein] synthase [Peptoniphilus harei]VEJ33241.1 2'-(5''-triphosphoribosyl)-3'-dephospho-CoA:apo-citrate lyase [Peptoniphilus harei]